MFGYAKEQKFEVSDDHKNLLDVSIFLVFLNIFIFILLLFCCFFFFFLLNLLIECVLGLLDCYKEEKISRNRELQEFCEYVSILLAFIYFYCNFTIILLFFCWMC